MAFCGKCGSVVEDGMAFCSRCGTPVTAAAPGSPVYGTGVAMASNIAALLSYILGFITGIIFLMLEPYKHDRYVRFHAFQSIFFSVAVMIVWMVYSVFLGFALVGFLWMIMGLLSMVFSLAVFVYWLFVMYKAYNNERYMIPFIGELAAKQAG